MPRLLVLFSLTNLVLGTGAFVLGGILGPISESLDISVQAAGQAITAYAISTAILAPLMLVATGKWKRKRAMQLALLLVALGNGVCALAPDLLTLMAGRVLMGMGAVFTPIAAGIAVASSEPGRQGRSLSIVFLGISLSYVVGVPLGAWLGFRFGWQVPLAAVGAAALLMLVVVSLRVPLDIEAPGASLRGLPALLTRARRCSGRCCSRCSTSSRSSACSPTSARCCRRSFRCRASGSRSP